MTTVRCPRCHDEVTLPARAGKRTHVRCPLCLEDYLLEEALRNSPPVLEVIGGELEPVMAGAPAAGGYAAMNDMDAGFTPAGSGDDGGLMLAPQPAGNDVFGTVGPEAGEAAVSPAGGVRAAPRPRRKQRSPLGTIFGVVFGGALGVGLAPLAIWWILAIFKPNADDLDPLGLAPKLPESLRFVLPAKLRAQVEGSVAKSNGGQSGGNTRPNPINNGNNTPTPMPVPNPNDIAGTNTNTNVTPEPLDPLTPTVESPTIPTTPTPDENPEPPPLKPVVNPEPPPNARQATELLAALTTARGATETYSGTDAADKEARKKAAIELYEAACQIGPLLKGLDWENANLASAKDEMEAFVGEQMDKVSMVGTLAARRINDPDAPPGILVAGKVTNMAAVGKQFTVTLAVGKAMQEVVVITPQNPEDLCALDDTLLVLGAIERDPSKVKGYNGPAELLVVGGYLRKVE